MSLIPSRTSDYITGTNLSLVCLITPVMNDSIDISTSVNITWTKNSNPITTGDRVYIMQSNMMTYTSSTLVFTSLSRNFDPGNYSCMVQVITQQLFVQNSSKIIKFTEINITGKAYILDVYVYAYFRSSDI